MEKYKELLEFLANHDDFESLKRDIVSLLKKLEEGKEVEE